MNIYTQNCVIRDKVIFLHHHLSRSPSEFLHQLGLFYTSSVSTVSTFLHLWAEQWFDPTQLSSLWTLEGNKAHKVTLELVNVCQESHPLFLENIVQAKSFNFAPNPDFSHLQEYLEAIKK